MKHSKEMEEKEEKKKQEEEDGRTKVSCVDGLELKWLVPS